MATFCQQICSSAIREALRAHQPLRWTSCCRSLHVKTTVKENDIVLLRQKFNDRILPILTKPLRPGGVITTYRDTIAVDDIIGKGIRDLVTTKTKGTAFRIHQPSLAEYINLCPRIVTPIYPQDANLIVSLLDLHPKTPATDGDGGPSPDKLEIFEAGTGHGSLTLNLARAIHGANKAPPEIPLDAYGVESSLAHEAATKNEKDFALDIEQEAQAKREAYDTWRVNRRAVIHSLDASASHSAHAQRVVKNFRNGMYFDHIDFHVSSIEEYLSRRLAKRDGPFLGHAILDLPSPHSYMEIIGRALKPDGLLITFSPNITQINSCVHVVNRMRLPFVLEKVLELGAGIAVGGREWDIRLVKPRALLRAESAVREQVDDGGESISEGFDDQEVPEIPDTAQSGWEMICKPKIGERITVGAFLGVWRRMDMGNQKDYTAK